MNVVSLALRIFKKTRTNMHYIHSQVAMYSREFTVTVAKEKVVATAASREEKRLPLSNLDLLLPPLGVGVFLCYKSSPPSITTTEENAKRRSFHAKVASLKEALARVLTIYHHFGGDVVMNPWGEPEILCHNRGVDFVQAYADIELRDLDLYALEGVEHKLMPKKKVGTICSIQVTELKCGGVIVACLFDHRVADAHSANMFILSWAEAAASKLITTIPSYDLSPITTPHNNVTTFDNPFISVSSLPSPDPNTIDETRPPVSRIYRIAAKHIHQIQAQSPHRTKLECFGAHLWQAIARQSSPSATTISLGFLVDGRKTTIPPMSNYFGNVLSVPYETRSLEELKRIQPEEVAEIVHEIIRSANSREHFQRLVQWVEMIRPRQAIAKAFAVEGEAVVVSSGRSVPLYEVDLGWGRPVLWSPHFPWGGRCGYVMPMPSSRENRDWLVYMRMRRNLLQRLEREEGAIFQPVAADYLMRN